MKRINAAFLICVLVIIMQVLAACQGTLTVAFDAGEYGEVIGSLTQTVDSKHDVTYPEIEAHDGYIFIGFDKFRENLPNWGRGTLKAQYVKFEYWWVDNVTHERFADDYRFEVPITHEAYLPHVEIKVTNMHNGVSETHIGSLARGFYPSSEKHESLPALVFAFPENDFLQLREEQGEVYPLLHNPRSEDWETTLEIVVQRRQSGTFYTPVESIRLDVFRDHDRIVGIDVTGQQVRPKDSPYWYAGTGQPLLRAGDLVCLEGDRLYQTGFLKNNYVFPNDMVYVVERIWSIYGDEIKPENFADYVFFVPLENSNLTNNNDPYLQLTDLLDYGWRIDVYVYHPIDDVRSETYTINVF